MNKISKEKRMFSAFEWVAMVLIAVLAIATIVTTILIVNLNDKKKSLEHENEQIQTEESHHDHFDKFIITDFDNQL